MMAQFLLRFKSESWFFSNYLTNENLKKPSQKHWIDTLSVNTMKEQAEIEVQTLSDNKSDKEITVEIERLAKGMYDIRTTSKNW